MKKIGYENLGILFAWKCGTGKLFPGIAQYIFRDQEKKIKSVSYKGLERCSWEKGVWKGLRGHGS